MAELGIPCGEGRGLCRMELLVLLPADPGLPAAPPVQLAAAAAVVDRAAAAVRPGFAIRHGSSASPEPRRGRRRATAAGGAASIPSTARPGEPEPVRPLTLEAPAATTPPGSPPARPPSRA